MTDAIQLIAFDAAIAWIEQLSSRELAEIPSEERCGGPPLGTLRKGSLEIELRFDRLPRDAFFEILEITGKYARSLGELRPAFAGCTFLADVHTALQRSRDPNVPPPFRVALGFDPRGGGKVSFGRVGLFLQEELNCVMDVWRKLVRRPPPVVAASQDDAPILLSYEQIAERLDRTAAAELAGAPSTSHNGRAPAVSYRKGTLCVVLELDVLPRDSFLPVMEVLSRYMRTFSSFAPSAWGCSVVCDTLSALQRKPPRTGSASTPLPAPFKVTFTFDLRGGGKVTFEKDSLLMEEELLCVLEVWRKLAIRQSSAAGTVRDPRLALGDLGAIVFDPQPEPPNAIAGYEAVKQEIRRTVILPLLDPAPYLEVARLTRGDPRPNLPRAVLFEGPPGTGKTTMARALASEASVPLVYVPVESIMSKWYGESERRLDGIFDRAALLPRSIVFLDEIDAFAGSREAPIHEASRRILSVLLRQLQGLVVTSNLIVIGATNRGADLDPALSSRFARTIQFPLPDHAARVAIVARYAQQLSPSDLDRLAAATEGASGRTLEDTCSAAERAWCSHLIDSQSPVTAPPLEAYLAALPTLSPR